MASIKITLSDPEFRDLKFAAMKDGLRFSVFAGQMYRRGFTLHQNRAALMSAMVPDKMPGAVKLNPKGKAADTLKTAAKTAKKAVKK